MNASQISKLLKKAGFTKSTVGNNKFGALDLPGFKVTKFYNNDVEVKLIGRCDFSLNDVIAVLENAGATVYNKRNADVMVKA